MHIPSTFSWLQRLLQSNPGSLYVVRDLKTTTGKYVPISRDSRISATLMYVSVTKYTVILIEQRSPSIDTGLSGVFNPVPVFKFLGQGLKYATSISLL